MLSTPPVRDDRRPASPTRSRADAFSLAELAIVVAIIGVVAAIATPRFASAHARYRIRAAEQRILADFEYAQRIARSQSKSVTITFDAANDRYALTGAPSPLGESGAYQVDLGDEPYAVDIFSVSSDSGVSWTFDENGACESGQIVLETPKERRTITIGAADGGPITATKTRALITRVEGVKNVGANQMLE